MLITSTEEKGATAPALSARAEKLLEKADVISQSIGMKLLKGKIEDAMGRLP